MINRNERKAVGNRILIGIGVLTFSFLASFFLYSIKNKLSNPNTDIRFIISFLIMAASVGSLVLILYYYKKNINKLYFACMYFLILAIFIILYAKYIYGDALYVYTDVGSDTFYGYTTGYVQILDKIRQLDFSNFSLNTGIGNYSFGASNACMDFPFFLILLLFNNKDIYLGLLTVTLLKYFIIATFSYSFFRRRGNLEKESILLSLIWTYSSWNILWGQHYWFLTVAVYFTLMIFFLDSAMRIDLKYWWLYSITTGVFSSFNIYSCYTCCAAAGIYVLYVIYIEKAIVKRKNIVNYFISTLMGVIMFFPLSFKWLWTLRESARSSRASFTLLNINYNKIVLNIARFLSSDLFGVKNYHGANNLYEDPVLEISIIVLVCSVVWAKKGVLNKCFLVLLFLSTYSDAVSIIFNFFPNKRWYNIILFFETLIIADTLHDWGKKEKILKKKDNCIIIITLLLGIIILFSTEKFTSYAICNYLIIAYKFVVLIVFWIGFNKTYKIANVVYALVVLEIVLSNYNIVNNREYISVNNLNNYINEDINNLVGAVQEKDSSLYRINNKICRSILSDGALYGYNSTNGYLSLNNAYYIEFIKNLNEIGSAYSISHDVNHADISCDNYVMKTLLGVKYIITDESEINGGELIKSNNGSNIFLNNLYIPMGYCYEKSISKDRYFELSSLEKNLALLQSYYSDDVVLNDVDKDEEMEEIEFDYGQNNTNVQCVNSIYSMINTSENMKLDLYPKATGKDYAGLQLKFNCKSDTAGYSVIVRYLSGEDIVEKLVWLNSGEREYSLFLEGYDISQISIECITNENCINYYISEIEVEEWRNTYDDFYKKRVLELRENAGSDIKYKNDIYSAKLVCHYPEGMYCIPFTYSQNWTAYVNGNKVPVNRINDTMCGITVHKGDNIIVMVYEYKFYSYIVILSMFITFLFVFAFFRYYNRCKKN